MCATRRLTPLHLLVFLSASNAIKGEGLQEGLDWLQGNVSAVYFFNYLRILCQCLKKNVCILISIFHLLRHIFIPTEQIAQ